MKHARTAYRISSQRHRQSATFTIAAALVVASCGSDEPINPLPLPSQLAGFASLPAATFAEGPTSGAQLGTDPINGQMPPFTDKQPVQGFSAVLDNGDGTFLGMADNGYGNIENSADFNLRVYTLRPDFKTASGGAGKIAVEGYIELSDPDQKVSFAIVNHFTTERILTGADFDPESMQRAPDGTLWIGDEFGPFLLHIDAKGKLLDAPIPLPDLDAGGDVEIHSPQNPFSEESSTLRVMNAFRTHAKLHGSTKTPVVSPWEVMLNDEDPNTVAETRKTPPAGSGLTEASSEIFDVKSLHAAGYPVVPYTINAEDRMKALLTLGVDGIISDRPDLLFKAVAAFDANSDGTPGDLLDADGLIDGSKFDAQGHRGGRNLRPENTLPAFEVALDNLMTTLELDISITSDSVPVISHDPHVQAQKCRRADGAPYTAADEVLIRNQTFAVLQSTYICDNVFRGPEQLKDPALSPVASLFKTEKSLPNIYVMPGLDQLFAFVSRYIAYYKTGAGASEPKAALRAKNAERVRYNIETKVNPRAEFAARTIEPGPFAEIVASKIKAAGLTDRADIQSFDFRTLLYVQEKYPAIRTVYLFGDFPRFTDPTIEGSDDGTNLQDENGKNTPWLAGLFWPYLKTQKSTPFRIERSGGFESMALTTDGAKLLPMLEKPLTGDDKTIRIYEFDLGKKQYTGVHYKYTFDDKGVSASDFIMTDPTHGLVLERDPSQGDLNGFKALFEIKLGEKGAAVDKRLGVDLLKINDPDKLAPAGENGDVGFGPVFAFPFQTIESVVRLDGGRIAVMNDNNFPFSVGRHVGAKLPDDEEFIILDLGHALDAW
jgi:glycerophosphoryl diester phosphodiesterase